VVPTVQDLIWLSQSHPVSYRTAHRRQTVDVMSGTLMYSCLTSVLTCTDDPLMHIK
jgi:hypothetical protein